MLSLDCFICTGFERLFFVLGRFRDPHQVVVVGTTGDTSQLWWQEIQSRDDWIRAVDIVSAVVGQGLINSELQMPHLRWRGDATTSVGGI